MAQPAQLVGGRQARHAAADDGDLPAGFLRRALEGELRGQRVVADELLDRVDADEVLHLVAVAAFLAGCRADPAHDGGEGIGIGRAAEGVFLPGHAGRRLLDATHDLQPAADVLPGRAASLAGRGAVYVGRALVGRIFIEDVLAPALPDVVVVGVSTESQLVCHGVYLPPVRIFKVCHLTLTSGAGKQVPAGARRPLVCLSGAQLVNMLGFGAV